MYAFSGQPLHYYGGMTDRNDDGRLKPLHASVLACREPGVSCFTIDVVLSMETRIWPRYVLHALTHTLPWVLPGAGAATAKAAARWLAPPCSGAEHAAEFEAHR